MSADAIRMAQAALARKPDDPQAWHALARAQADAGDFTAAFTAFEQAAQRAPGDALLFSDCASALAQARQFEQAAAWANRALHLDSQCAEAWQALALTHLGRQQPREAALALNRVLAIQPRLAQAHFLYGVALEMLVMPERAELAYREALACAPDHLHANISLAQLASARQDYNTAIACWRAALAADPGNVQLMNDLGTEFSEIGQHAEAVAVWDQALVLQPDNAEVAYNRARSLLVQGFTPEALGAYEVRRRLPTWPGSPPGPELQSLDQVTGRRILLFAEQGLGDAIQFCRYALALKDRGAGPILRVRAPLVRLLRSMPGVTVVSEAEPLPAYDLQAPMMSLLRLCSGDPLAAAVPYLHAEPARVAAWRARIGAHGFKVGIAWQGSTGAIDKGRSFPVAQFAPLCALPGVRLIALQKGQGLEQLAHLPAGMMIERLGEDFDAGPDAFLDTAAAMQALDLVVTSDTAVAHLAGATGMPVWLALKLSPDWRWGMEGAQTLWYPTMRLFRQTRHGDWTGVFREMAAVLPVYMQERTTP